MSDASSLFPPSQVPFPELDFGGGLPQAPTFSATRTAQPYDLVEDLPGYQHDELGWQTQRARGGAVHYSEQMQWTLRAEVPTIDRAFYFTVDEREVGLWGFWGDENNPEWSFVVRTKSTESKMTLFDQGSSVYYEVLVNSDVSSQWGYVDNASTNYKAIAEGGESKLMVWGSDTYNALEQDGSESVWKAAGGGGNVDASTSQLEGKTATFQRVKFLEDLKPGKYCKLVPKWVERIVLATEELEPEEHGAHDNHHCEHEIFHKIKHEIAHELHICCHGNHHGFEGDAPNHDEKHGLKHQISHGTHECCHEGHDNHDNHHGAQHTAEHATHGVYHEGHAQHTTEHAIHGVYHEGHDNHDNHHGSAHGAHGCCHEGHDNHDNHHGSSHPNHGSSHGNHDAPHDNHHGNIHSKIHSSVHDALNGLGIDCSGGSPTLTGLPN